MKPQISIPLPYSPRMKCDSPRLPQMEAFHTEFLHPRRLPPLPESQLPPMSLPDPTKSFSTGVVLSSSPTSSFSFLSSGSNSSRDFSSSAGRISGEIRREKAVVPRMLMKAATGRDSAMEGRKRCIGRHDRVSWGSASVIGRRKEMEDAVVAVPGFMSHSCGHIGGCTAPGSRSSDQISLVHFFDVYDGHGGSKVARFCAERMHQVIAEEWGREATDRNEWRRKWETVLSNGFERADEEVFRDAIGHDMVGSTAVVAVVSVCQIIMSNYGDSRAVLCRGTHTIPLTLDQKPDIEDELTRIEQEGGRVINWNDARVLGVLAMSRAIGDRYMRPYIIPVPRIKFMTRTLEDECLILASDGLWEVMSNDEAGQLAHRLLRKGRRNMVAGGPTPAQFAADNLKDIATTKSSSDNISVIVVDLKSQRRRQPSQSNDR